MFEKKFTVFYPGKFCPPTKFHVKTAYMLSRRPDAGQVVIVIGNSGEISSDKKYDLWKLLLRSEFNANIILEKSTEGSSLSYIYNRLMKDPKFPCYIAIDEKSGQKPEFANHFNKFPYQEIELIASQFTEKSDQALQFAKEGNINGLRPLLPDNFTDEDIQEYADIITGSDSDVEEDNSYGSYKGKILNTFNESFWKESLSLTEEDSEKFIFSYVPKTYAPGTNSLNKVEHDQMMYDLDGKRMPLSDYIEYCLDKYKKENSIIHGKIAVKLDKENKDKIDFAEYQDDFIDDCKKGKGTYATFIAFYNKFKSKFPDWAYANKSIYDKCKNLQGDDYIGKIRLNESTVESDIDNFGWLYESTINLNDVYPCKEVSNDKYSMFTFNDSKGFERSLIYYNVGDHVVKITYKDPDSGKHVTGRIVKGYFDPKVLNTFAKIMIEEILPNTDYISFAPEDDIRYRFFRALFHNNLDKSLYDMQTNGNIIIISKKDI